MSAVESYFRNSSSRIQKVEGKYIFIQGRKFLDFSSNNFLGLKNDERIKESAKEAIDNFGIDIDSNKTLSSHGDLYLGLRKKICEMKGQEETILYNAGYNVSAGIIPNLVGEKDVIFSDSQNFIDIYQGIYKSKAHLIRYKHNDIENLKNKLIKYRDKFKRALIITDTIFFTDGSEAKLKEIIELRKSHDFILMVDDSNGDGIHGENGNGIASKPFLQPEIDLIIGDFSRNYGGLGEYVCGKEKYINILLKNSLSKSMMYKVLISPLASTISRTAMDIADKELDRRENVLKLSEILKKELEKLKLNTGQSTTHIIPIIFKDNETVIKFSKFLYKNGIVASTTVGKTTIDPRVKFYINAMFEEEDIESLLSAVQDFIETSQMLAESEPQADVEEVLEEIKKEEVAEGLEKLEEIQKEIVEEKLEDEVVETPEEIPEVKSETIDSSELLIETEPSNDTETVSIDDIFQTADLPEDSTPVINEVVDASENSEAKEEVDVEDTEEFKKSKEDAFDNAAKMLEMLD